jgi:hypothetical protein
MAEAPCYWWFHKWSKWSDPTFITVVDQETKGTAKVIALQKSTCMHCNAIRYRRQVKWDLYEHS